MNLEKIMISSLIGLIAGGVSFFLAEKILSKDLKYRSLIKNALVIFITTLITLIGTRTFLKSETNSLTKESLDKILTNNASSPFFPYIKKHDLSSYEEFLNESLSIIKENSSKSETELLILFQRRGAKFAARYYKNASGEVLINYLKKYIEFLKETSEIEPEAVCRLMFPETFGATDENIFVRIKSGAALMLEIEKIVISGIKKEANDSDKSSAILFEIYKSDFFSRHPDIQDLFTNIANLKSYEDKRKLALGITKLYEEILTQPRLPAISIYRFLLTGE